LSYEAFIGMASNMLKFTTQAKQINKNILTDKMAIGYLERDKYNVYRNER